MAEFNLLINPRNWVSFAADMTQPHLSTRRILSLFWPKWRGMKNVLIRQDFTVALFATLFSLFYCPSSVQLHKALKFQTPATRVSLFSRPKFLENEKNSKISLRTKFLFKTHLLLILPVRAHVFAARHFNTIFIEGFSCLESINSTINSQKTNKFWQEGSNTSDAISSGSDACDLSVVPKCQTSWLCRNKKI